MLQAWEKGQPGEVAAMAVLQLAIVGVVIAVAIRIIKRTNRA
jgi:hypothetical protein